MDKYIDAERALFVINGLRGPTRSPAQNELIKRAKDGIERLPSADVEPVRHGRWDGEGDGYAETEDGEMALVYDVWICSECGYTIDDGTDDPDLLPNYCPHCGAKMSTPAD